jgi:hypothetical protein
MLQEHVTAGRGQGHGTDYQPWLQISRRKSPSNSNMNFSYLPKLERHGHFLSRNEVNLARFLLWLGAVDLREQFPLWPFEHPHPLYGHPALKNTQLPWSRGLLAIATDLGIDHGCYVGTKIPYVATTDFMLTIITDGQAHAVAIAAKPSAIIKGKQPASARVKERLALECAYAKEMGIEWRLMSDGDLSRAMRDNLELTLPASQLSKALNNSSLVEDFCGALSEGLQAGNPLGEVLHRVIERSGLNSNDGKGLFYHGLWTRQLPVDLRHPLVHSQPARLTDFTWARDAADRIFGGGRHD